MNILGSMKTECLEGKMFLIVWKLYGPSIVLVELFGSRIDFDLETGFCNVVVVDNEVANPTSKAVQVSRSSPATTVPPRSSISLTAFKTTIQPKPATQVCNKNKLSSGMSGYSSNLVTR